MKNLKVADISGSPRREVNLDGFWLALKDAGARLTEIDFNYAISEALMTYLASYEGLVKVGIQPVSSTLPSTSSSFAKHVLRRHAPTLTFLEIFVIRKALLSRNFWQAMAFNPMLWPAPATFLRLTHMDVLTLETWDLEPQTLQCALDYVSECPSLQRLKLTWTKPGLNSSTLDFETMRGIGGEVFVRSALRKFIITLAREEQRVVWNMFWQGDETRCQLSRFGPNAH
ncbi:hypothetical protein AX16_009254 [Volvariella volvacea WC 439]|nr:hypothetical protein AX16_009254 [Volvariella volvacea WC 439]